MTLSHYYRRAGFAFAVAAACVGCVCACWRCACCCSTCWCGKPSAPGVPYSSSRRECPRYARRSVAASASASAASAAAARNTADINALHRAFGFVFRIIAGGLTFLIHVRCADISARQPSRANSGHRARFASSCRRSYRRWRSAPAGHGFDFPLSAPAFHGFREHFAAVVLLRAILIHARAHSRRYRHGFPGFHIGRPSKLAEYAGMNAVFTVA